MCGKGNKINNQCIHYLKKVRVNPEKITRDFGGYGKG